MKDMNNRWLNLDAIISEEDEIMRKNYNIKDKDPKASLEFNMARTIKIFLLRKYAEQENDILRGQWITDKDGIELCNICLTPRKVTELHGKCVICNSEMEC